MSNPRNWSNETEIVNLLSDHADNYRMTTRQEYIRALAGKLSKFSTKTVKQALDDIAGNPPERFPEWSHIRGACQNRLPDAKGLIPGFDEKTYAQFQTEEKEYKKLKSYYLEKYGPDNFQKYYTKYLEAMFPNGMASWLMGVIGNSAWEKPALFDLKNAKGDPRIAIQIMQDRAAAITRQKQRDNPVDFAYMTKMIATKAL